MRWNIILECVGKDGKQSTITLGAIERLAGSTTAENLGVNLQESKQIENRLQDNRSKTTAAGALEHASQESLRPFSPSIHLYFRISSLIR